ncbi:MAG TPA: TonB family protein [Longimicrobium sp.]|nr:TonB family protein [Longimicrobium sp.]
MKTTPIAIASLVLLAAAGGCQPCTCPAAAPAPVVLPPPPPPAGQPAQPAPAQPAPSQPAPAGPVRITNEASVTRLMAGAVPRQIYDAGVTGDVLLDVVLNSDGTVQSATDVEATNETFRAPAQRIVRSIRFSPPAATGTTVRVRMRFSRRSEVEIVEP